MEPYEEGDSKNNFRARNVVLYKMDCEVEGIYVRERWRSCLAPMLRGSRPRILGRCMDSEMVYKSFEWRKNWGGQEYLM